MEYVKALRIINSDKYVILKIFDYYDHEYKTTKMKEKKIYCWNCGKDITGMWNFDCNKQGGHYAAIN